MQQHVVCFLVFHSKLKPNLFLINNVNLKATINI